MSKPRILAIITAREGSKRIPKKNIRSIAGKPLVLWTIEASLACKDLFYAVVLSTNDKQIASIGTSHGIDVPFLRPEALSGDEAGSLGVVQHAIKFIEERDGLQMDWVLILQPTSPLRRPADIRAAVDLALEDNCESIISVTKVPIHPIFIKKINSDGYLQSFSLEEPEGMRRQDVNPPAFVRNGAIYLTKRKTLMEENSIYGKKSRPYIMPAERSVDIDELEDFFLAERLLYNYIL